MSSIDETFEKTKRTYRDALNKKGFQEKLSDASAQNKNDKNCNEQRKCNIICYNPPYP